MRGYFIKFFKTTKDQSDSNKKLLEILSVIITFSIQSSLRLHRTHPIHIQCWIILPECIAMQHIYLYYHYINIIIISIISDISQFWSVSTNCCFYIVSVQSKISGDILLVLLLCILHFLVKILQTFWYQPFLESPVLSISLHIDG